ncbi:hypothetical protein [Pseudoduganella chitinolytica]|uniref:Uncharacterized protein n=1 Tax=Pseudoduganella chitinolytica TaxID=34070 RepID=A0ABY8BDB9_9BURK|nr:hypothetical protein [Pseudoduganella chitinolytica]WEF33820.1 hypothetical protein PX653_03285 [Pseudoduganella chitinolytica]
MTPTPSQRRAEKVGVAQIRIHQQAGRSTAVLGSFVAADKLLKSWASDMRDHCACEFEIRYQDGSRLSGQYPMWQKTTTRQSLGAYVRRVLEQVDGLAAFRMAASTGPDRFLECYEVEDFA